MYFQMAAWMLTALSFTSVGRGSNGLLLADPSLLILHISKQLLKPERVRQFLLACSHGLTQGFITHHQGLLFLADVVSIKMPSLLELATLDCYAINAILRDNNSFIK